MSAVLRVTKPLYSISLTAKQTNKTMKTNDCDSALFWSVSAWVPSCFSHVWLSVSRQTRLLCSWDSPGKNTGEGCHALLQGIFPTQDWTHVSHVVGRFFLSEPPGKPKKMRVGNLSLLYRIFLTEASNLGLLHYRQILYQLSYQGNPFPLVSSVQLLSRV